MPHRRVKRLMQVDWPGVVQHLGHHKRAKEPSGSVLGCSRAHKVQRGFMAYGTNKAKHQHACLLDGRRLTTLHAIDVNVVVNISALYRGCPRGIFA